MKNLKDTFSTIASVMIAMAGVVLALSQAGLTLPKWLNVLGIVLGVVGGSIIGILTGKNPDGTTKTADQVITQNNK
jgi:hypothetical protein